MLYYEQIQEFQAFISNLQQPTKSIVIASLVIGIPLLLLFCYWLDKKIYKY